MILCGNLKDDLDEVICLCKYHPYRITGEDGTKVKNPAFDSTSGRILDLKSEPSDARKAEARNLAVQAIFKFLDTRVERGIVITVVPSHDPTKLDSGIRAVAQRLAQAERIDGTSCLVRKTKVAKKTGGGSRDIHVDLNSICVKNGGIIKGQAVLLLDDVTTSGNTLAACKQLLENAGAKVIQRVAIGKTVH